MIMYYDTPIGSHLSFFNMILGASLKRSQNKNVGFFLSYSSLLIWPTYSDLSRSNFFGQFMTTEDPFGEAKKMCCSGWNWENRWPLEISNQSAFKKILLCNNVTTIDHGPTGPDPFLIHQYVTFMHPDQVQKPKRNLLDQKWNQNEIFLIGNGIFLIRNYPGAPVFHVPCIATQPKKFIKGSPVVKDHQKKFDLEWSL